MEQMMRPVAQHQLERVLSRRQFNKRLSLSGTEMKMILVLWDRFIRVQCLIYIDHQMVVTCVWRVDAGGRDAHARETKLHPKRTSDGITVLRADDIDKGIRRASGLSRRNGKAADYKDDKELDPTVSRKKHSAGPPCLSRTFVRAVHYTEFGFLPKMPIAGFTGFGRPAGRIERLLGAAELFEWFDRAGCHAQPAR